jgi:hypothetical protein
MVPDRPTGGLPPPPFANFDPLSVNKEDFTLFFVLSIILILMSTMIAATATATTSPKLNQ